MYEDHPVEQATGEFSVYQFFPDGNYETVKRWVDAPTALAVAISLSKSVGARIGTTREVIVTDGGDSCNWRWEYGLGVTYPTAQMRGEGSNG